MAQAAHGNITDVAQNKLPPDPNSPHPLWINGLNRREGCIYCRNEEEEGEGRGQYKTNEIIKNTIIVTFVNYIFVN